MILAVLFFKAGLTGKVYAQTLEGLFVHSRKQHGGMCLAPMQLGQLLHGLAGQGIGGCRAGQCDQNFIGVQAGVAAAKVAGLESLNGLNAHRA